MITDADLLRKLEDGYAQKTKTDHRQNIKIFESLWREAKALGALASRPTLDDISAALKVARFLNPD